MKKVKVYTVEALEKRITKALKKVKFGYRLLIQGIGDYQTAIKATLDEIGLNDGDINGPGGNHLKLIVVDQIGFIVYETKVMNF